MANVLLCMFEFGDKIRDAALYTVINYLFLYILQFLFAVAYMIFSPTGDLLQLTFPVLTVMHSLILVFIIFLQIKMPVGKYVKAFIRINYVGNIILILVGIVMIVIQLVQKSSFHFKNDYFVSMTIGIALFALFFVKMYEEIKQNAAYKERLLLQEKYNKVYEDLLEEIRHRQHDYNNHLQALFSMNMAYDDVDELKRHQIEYYKKIDRQDDYDLLKNSGSPVLAAFVYLKVQNADKKQVNAEVRIDVERLEHTGAFTDIIELVGNLFDNACEATEAFAYNRMFFSIVQNGNLLNIESSNPYEWEEDEKVDRFFKDGMSTKGKQHGIGLANVRKIVKKYHGVMEVAFDKKEEIKLIKFHICLRIELN